MTLNQLKYFCETCRCHSITAAANQLFVTQPAISLAIRELEAEFGITLFTRFNNRLTLTEDGALFYKKADYILQYVRATQNSIGSNVETLYHILDNNAEALEFAIREESAVTYIPLAELNLRKNLLVGCLNRNGRIRIPRGQDTIQVGDTVIIVTTHKGLRDITDILAK